MSPKMQACIDECLRCYQTCLGMASNHCLEVGGRHVEPAHFRLMLACAETCRTSAHLMLIGTEQPDASRARGYQDHDGHQAAAGGHGNYHA